MWWTLAGQYRALPLENRDALQILLTERPQISKPRNRYICYPGGAEVPESVAPNIRNRSYSIAVEVDIQTPDASGVLFSHGSRFGGHALYIKDRKLKYVYNFVGLQEQVIESTQPIPTGHAVLSASFERAGDSVPAEGTLTLHVGETRRMHHQYGEVPVCDYGGGNAAEKVPHEPAVAVGAQHDQARLVLLGGLDDPFPGRGGLDRRAL